MVVPAPTNTIVDREAAWLAADATVQALATVTAYSKKRADGAKGIDLRIVRTTDTRLTSHRRERCHQFQLTLAWPLVSGASSMADDQRYLDALIEALLNRIHDLVGDHTHGGLFLSVGEPLDGPARSEGSPEVTRDDPLAALTTETPVLTARITYGATELEIIQTAPAPGVSSYPSVSLFPALTLYPIGA